MEVEFQLLRLNYAIGDKNLYNSTRELGRKLVEPFIARFMSAHVFSKFLQKKPDLY